MQISTFIFVHDQKIVMDFINNNKFSSIQNLKYVFLGSSDISEIKHLSNVIIARDLPYNIERLPKLTSFTGWYALVKNNLIKSNYVNLFEYDIILADNFSEKQNEALKVNPDVIGYQPFSVHDYNFFGNSTLCSDIVKSIKEIYNIDCYNYIKTIPKDNFCSITSNHTFSKNSLKDYIDWIDPMLDLIKESSMAGHNIERSIILFYYLQKKKFSLVKDVLFHFQFDSHKTQGVDPMKFIMNYENLIKS
jgi:hypothetical protein